ncbi:MmpS family transport accessory protein [Kribbella sp. NPDC051587]|uniref:MmpS family transport accessory protein n=1 Tax=Kribbella sp. NPDC051587 TaxID=3364119 RepID=UPI0037B34D71
MSTTSRRSRLPYVVLAVVGVFGLLVVGGLVGMYFWAKNNLERDVSYELTGPPGAQVRISYVTDDDPGRGRPDPVALPWSMTFHSWMTRRAWLTAGRPEGLVGPLTCTIRIDGKVVSTQTSPDSIVVCKEPDL